MWTKRSLALGVWLLPVAFVSAASQEPFKEAQYQETVVRDCEAAVQLYASYLKENTTHRNQRALAYLHRGLCLDKLGKTEEAVVDWKKIVQEYPDQPEPYADALLQLQKHQPSVRIVEVHDSTPIVKVVYETPPARWLVEFPRALFGRTLDSKGDLTDTATGITVGFVHFPQPNRGVGFEIGSLGNSGPVSARRSIAVFSMLARLEKPFVKGVSGYLKGGPGLYVFGFDNNGHNEESKANIGVEIEPGVVIGLPRGFAFNIGYALHVFGQSTPSDDFIAKIPANDLAQAEDVTQNRGVRFVGGPTLSLSFRW